MAIEKNYIIEKSNFLNEMKYCDLNLQELRFLAIYLSKINVRDPNTRKVRFSLDDFRKIMDLGRLNIENLRFNTRKILQNVVTIPKIENKGYTQFQLFKECEVSQDEAGNYFIEIDAHDKALPYFFQFKDNPYFTYRLWNILKLTGINQQRMYEILKQHEKCKHGEWTYTLKELKELLFIDDKKYSLFNNFKLKVLDSCKRALAENTDICFDYELIKKGRSVIKIKFIINKNTNYVNQLSFDEFLQQQEETKFKDEPIEFEYSNDNIRFFADCCNNEFNESEMQEIINLLVSILPYTSGDKDKCQQKRYLYLQRHYNYSKNRATGSVVNYLKTVLERKIDEKNE